MGSDVKPDTYVYLTGDAVVKVDPRSKVLEGKSTLAVILS